MCLHNIIIWTNCIQMSIQLSPLPEYEVVLEGRFNLSFVFVLTDAPPDQRFEVAIVFITEADNLAQRMFDVLATALIG